MGASVSYTFAERRLLKKVGTKETAMEYRIISADDHIDMAWLPRDLWQQRVPIQWRERVPRVVDTADGPYWY